MFGGACMSEKLDFYEVNIDYVKYLKQFDSRIPDVVYQNRNKFVCGTLFKINGLNFFAPVSSFNIKQNSNYVIEVGNVPVGSVRYSFMFPVPDSEIKQKVINNESDYQYRFLLRQELKYCNKNREVIQSKAKAIYHKALDKNTTYHKFCCDFQLLEEKCKEWIYDKTIVKHEKECLLDLQNKIWRYSHFEKESELITMDMFPSEVKNLFWTFLLNSFHEHDYTNESYFDEYSKKHEKCIYKGNKLSKGAIQELYNMNRVGYDWLICNKDGRIFFADHGLYPLEKGDKVWNNNEIDGYSVSAFVEDKKKRYKSLVSWEDEQPFDIYEFLLTQDIEM